MRKLLFIIALASLAGCNAFDGWGTPEKHFRQSKVAPAMMMPPTSEWFPSLVPPTAFTENERIGLLRACSLTAASVIWVQYIDLDSDRCNDAIVTLSLPPSATGKAQQWATVTFVFRGRSEGAFTQRFDSADIWFSLVTEIAISHPDYDLDVRRQFSVKHTQQGFFLTLNDCRYGNDGGDPATRFLQFRGSETTTINTDQLPRANPLPMQLPPLPGNAQTRPGE